MQFPLVLCLKSSDFHLVLVCLVVAAVLSVVDICHVISILADVGAAIEFILVGVAAGSELAGLFLCAESDNLNDNIRLFTFRC